MNEKTQNNPIELLAPAGSQKTFFAAIEAGANAVYLGLSDFNARMRADNFSIQDLETALPYAHSKNVQVFITLNTLIKQIELQRLTEFLIRLNALRPDALIVQDYGVAMLAQRVAPKVPLHASTQMTIHNSAGARLFEQLGFERVILARECSLDEISEISRKSNIGVEVFAHGALCYSYSGQCYFSSYLGGASANRGRCTQPCRRSYRVNKKDGSYFSAKDLCLIDRIPELIESGVVSIKIEGRLRSEAYISQVVSAYREAIDCAPKRASAQTVDKATRDYGRAKSIGHFDSQADQTLIHPFHTAGAGQFLGKVKSVSEGELRFACSTVLQTDDRIRITPKFEGEKNAFTLKTFQVKDSRDKSGKKSYHYQIPFTGNSSAGDLIFLVGSKAQKGGTNLGRLKAKFHKMPKYPANVEKQARAAQEQIASELQILSSDVRRFQRQFIRVALPTRAKDLTRLMDRRVDEYILPLRHRDVFSLPRAHRNSVVLRVPVFIRERNLSSVANRIRQAIKRGFTRFLIGNPAHIPLVSAYPEARMQFDYSFGMLNTVALCALARLGGEMVTLSIESDTKNLVAVTKASKNYPLELVVYGRPPLFSSSVKTPLPKSRGALEVEHRDENLFVELENDLTVVLPKRPFALMGSLKPHQVRPMASLRLELSGNELQKQEYDRLRTAVRKWEPLKGLRSFNFHAKGELK